MSEREATLDFATLSLFQNSNNYNNNSMNENSLNLDNINFPIPPPTTTGASNNSLNNASEMQPGGVFGGLVGANGLGVMGGGALDDSEEDVGEEDSRGM
jgi:hypothetical protein